MTERAWIMNIDQLRTFVAVADEMSISGAADRLGTTQPVVSRTVKRLEGELHASLFDRLPRGVALSHHGKVLYAEARQILAAHRRMIESFQTLSGDGRTHVRIGAGATWLEERLPSIIADFSRRHPMIRIDALYEPRFQVIESLLLGRVDIALAQFGVEPLPSDDVEYEELLKDRIVVAGRKRHPLAGRLDTPEGFRSLRWAIASSASGEERLRGLCKRFGAPDPAIQVRCHSASSLRGIVRETDLVALLPKFMVDREADGLEMLSTEFGLTLSKGILTPRQGSLSLGARVFRTCLREAFGRGSEKRPERRLTAEDVPRDIAKQGRLPEDGQHAFVEQDQDRPAGRRVSE